VWFTLSNPIFESSNVCCILLYTLSVLKLKCVLCFEFCIIIIEILSNGGLGLIFVSFPWVGLGPSCCGSGQQIYTHNQLWADNEQFLLLKHQT
jgi:hypothetical protein